MKSILVTGSSGFVGKYFVKHNGGSYKLKTVSLQQKKIEDIYLEGINTIIHLAGKAHQMQAIDPKIYFQVNFELTKKLADVAKIAGVRQFIFISTIKVFGNFDSGVLTIDSPCYPKNDPYGESKLMAEEYLKKIETPDFIVSIIRPPLVYGAGVKGNLHRLIGLVKKMPALPFGGISNQRSMVYVGNLAALIDRVIEKKSSGIFIAGDSQAYSTSHLIKRISCDLEKNTWLISLPKFVISIIHWLNPSLATRLFSSLIVENKDTNQKLEFTPPFTFEEGIKEMVQAYSK